MSTLGWVALGVVGWLLVATAVATVVGRSIWLRDRRPTGPQQQDPQADAERPEADPSAPHFG